jgi:AcrR family transcriptional regulator
MTTENTQTDTPDRPLLSAKMKERLYPAVLELFSRNDFHQVNLREIYKQTGISPSTIYKYFPSKEALLFSVLDEKISEIGKIAEVHIKGIESTREILRKIFWVTMDFYDRNPAVAVVAFITVPVRSWMREKSYVRKDAAKLFSEVCGYGHKRGEIDPAISSGDVMDLYFMHCYRQIHVWFLHGMKGKLADTLPRFYPIFWKAVSAECPLVETKKAGTKKG